jgi:type II pantothenate kinase
VSGAAGELCPVFVGADIGATLAKLATAGANGSASPHFEILPSHDTPRLAARIRELSPLRIGLTGGGAARLSEALGGRRCLRVDEFQAWGWGAARLLEHEDFPHDSRYLLVSLGTGTSILLIDAGHPVRVGGTALGGGTVLGLGSALIFEPNFEKLCELASRGERSRVDLVVSDIYRPGEIALPDEMTAAAFGKLGREGSPESPPGPEHLAAAIMGLVGENIGLICAGLSFATQVERVIYAGSTLRANPTLRTILDEVTRSTGRQPFFPQDGEFGGALGALERARATA